MTAIDASSVPGLSNGPSAATSMLSSPRSTSPSDATANHAKGADAGGVKVVGEDVPEDAGENSEEQKKEVQDEVEPDVSLVADETRRVSRFAVSREISRISWLCNCILE